MSNFPKQHEGPTRYKKGKSDIDQKPLKPVKIDIKESDSDIAQETINEPKKELDEENEITFLRGTHVLKLVYEKQKNHTYAIKILVDGQPMRPMTFTGRISGHPYWKMLKDKYS